MPIEYLLHFFGCFLAPFALRAAGFSTVDCLLLVAFAGVGKEMLDCTRPLGFVDTRDLIADGYGLLAWFLLDGRVAQALRRLAPKPVAIASPGGAPRVGPVRDRRAPMAARRLSAVSTSAALTASQSRAASRSRAGRKARRG